MARDVPYRLAHALLRADAAPLCRLCEHDVLDSELTLRLTLPPLCEPAHLVVVEVGACERARRGISAVPNT
jgi:hypothetical protein